MPVHDNKYLDKYEQLCGSRYGATAFVGRKARELAEKYDNVISHSEALSWLLSGVVPDGVRHYRDKLLQRSQRPMKYAEEYLLQIADEQVRKAVWISIQKSKNEGHLIYHYEEIYDPERKSRVRVLTNKLWYEIQELDL